MLFQWLMIPVHLSHTRLNKVSVFGHYLWWHSNIICSPMIHKHFVIWYSLVYCVVFYVEMFWPVWWSWSHTTLTDFTHLSTGTVHSWRAGDIKKYPKYNSMHTNETWSLHTVFTSVVYKQHSTVNHCTQKIACSYSTSSFLGDCTLHSHRLSYNFQANKTNTYFISKLK